MGVKCKFSFCQKRAITMEDYFCDRHTFEWQTSPEATRRGDGGYLRPVAISISEFWRRREQEYRAERDARSTAITKETPIGEASPPQTNGASQGSATPTAYNPWGGSVS